MPLGHGKMGPTPTGWLMGAACFSMLCSFFIGTKCCLKYREDGERTSTIVRFLGLKALSDFFMAMMQLLSISVDKLGGSQHHRGCLAVAFINQFAALSEASCNFCIALDVFLLIQSPLTYDTVRWRKYMMAYTLIVSFGTTGGMLATQKLGPSTSNHTCWVKHSSGTASWFLFGFLICYAVFCIYAVLNLVYKVTRAYRITNISYDGKVTHFSSTLARRMACKMVMFTGMFLFAWSFQIVRYIYQLVQAKEHNWLEMAGILSANTTGVWDLFVYYGSLFSCECKHGTETDDKETGENAEDDTTIQVIEENIRASVHIPGRTSSRAPLSTLMPTNIDMPKGAGPEGGNGIEFTFA